MRSLVAVGLDERLLSEAGGANPSNARLEKAFASGRLPERAAALARLVFDPDDARGPLAARVLASLLGAASAGELRALERDYRSPRFIREHDVLAELDRARWALRSSLDHEGRLGALAIGSVQRSGRVREEAVRELGAREEVVAVGLLLLRLNDPVAEIGRAAAEAVERWRVPSRASAVGRYLPLLDAFDSWVRAAHDGFARSLLDRFARDEAVLFSLATDDDAALRASAYRRLAALRVKRETIAEVLERALEDEAPRIRRWAAITAADGAVTPPEARAALLPRMFEDPNPRVREIALRYLRRQDEGAPWVERAVFDPNAGVRFHARRFAHRAKLRIAYRDRALAVLADPDADARALIGALALLSDNGLRDDAPAIQPFLHHPQKRVRREARRTLDLLQS